MVNTQCGLDNNCSDDDYLVNPQFIYWDLSLWWP